jgi:tripartite-type tricarboxylate transporter receptor subunit TctC
MKTKTLAVLTLSIAGALTAAGANAADAWPSRPIRLVVPFDAGAGTDTIQRFYANELSKALGQTVVIENVGGAGGAIGAAKVANSPADGYTLLGTIITAVAALPHLQHITYDPIKDFTPITRLGNSVTLIGTNNDSGIQSLQDLVRLAKQSPGKYSYGSAGIGSAPQFRFEALAAATGIQLTHVPYKGGTAFVSDLVAGRIQLFADGVLGAQLGKAGKVRLLAVIDDTRSSDFPDIPTVNEVVPNYQIPPTWYLLEGPAGLPPAIVMRIAAEVAKISRKPETAEFLKSLRSKPIIDPPDFKIAAEVQRDYDHYGEMIKRLGITAP